MNLDMNSKTIQNLAPRGRAAGENLGWIVRGNRPAHAVGETGDEHAAQWTRHRWTRLRSSVRGLDKYLVDLATQRSKLAVPQSGDLHANEYSFDDLAHKAHDLRFLPYRSKWNDTAARSLIQAMDALNKIDFAEANKRSTPPLRKLVLSTRADPETDLE